MKKVQLTDDVRYVDIKGRVERVSISAEQHPTNTAAGYVHVVRIRDGRQMVLKASSLRRDKLMA